MASSKEETPGSPGAHITPAMRQYKQFKEQFPDCVLFFRMGDFYEMFFDDARLANKVLGVTLTQRSEGIPMAGVPYHAVESYLRRMIRAGYRVAVCDQIEDPAKAKGIVARDVTRVITPGTLTDATLLEEGTPAPLAAVMFHGEGREGLGPRAKGQGISDLGFRISDLRSEEGQGPRAKGQGISDLKNDTEEGSANPQSEIRNPKSQVSPDTRHPTPAPKSEIRNPKSEISCSASIAWAELSTGSFHIATLDVTELNDELARINPREILYVETANNVPPARVKELGDALHCPLVARPAWQFRHGEAIEVLCKQFKVTTLAGFGLTGEELSLGAASAVLHYLLETQRAVSGREGISSVAHRNPELPPLIRIDRIAHLQPPKVFQRHEHLVIDQISLRSLEVESTIRSGKAEGSLLATLQGCRTAMGKRMLRQWLCYPLRDKSAIETRQRVVGAFVNDSQFLEALRLVLDDIQDVQRIAARISVGRGSPRDVVGLGISASKAWRVVELLKDRPAMKPYHDALASVTPDLTQLGNTMLAACVEEPPVHLRDGGLIRDGFDATLDEYRGLQRDSNTWLAGYQKELIEQTGIASLKVGYNQVFGYYIELTAANKDKAPPNWTRKQTLKNAERFITPQLKEFEGKVLSARDRAVAREQELFVQMCNWAQQQLPALHLLSETVAQLDTLACFAQRAVKFRYVCPQLVEEPVLQITAGRHPVLDELLGEKFVANEVELGGKGQGPRAKGHGEEAAGTDSPPSQGGARGGSEAQSPGIAAQILDLQEAGRPTLPQPLPKREGSQSDPQSRTDDPQSLGPRPFVLGPSASSLALITGPNMAGKSTYIRQTALITLMAHTGSFVPAEAATIGLCDRIFTRIGASDELHTGQSTFMVEMTETANICHHATANSLVILDEIGRGTSTLDGLSLAWAIAEHLARVGCRTLFATHYHELTQLAEPGSGFSNITNLNVTVREWQGQIVFLHRIVPGAASRSYGIHVAKIAGLPANVVKRADELLEQLEVNHNTAAGGGGEEASLARIGARTGAGGTTGAGVKVASAGQMSLFTEYLDHPVVSHLREIDLNALTPMQAFDALRRLREQVES